MFGKLVCFVITQMQEQIERYEHDMDQKSRERVRIEKELEDMKEQMKGAAQWEEKLLEIVRQWVHCILCLDIFIQIRTELVY